MILRKLSASKIISSKIQNINSVYQKCLLRIYVLKMEGNFKQKKGSDSMKGLSLAAMLAHKEQKGNKVPCHSTMTREHGPGLARLSIVKKIP